MTDPAAPVEYTLEDAADDIWAWAVAIHEIAAAHEAALRDLLGGRWVWRLMRPLVLGRVRSEAAGGSATGRDAPM